MRGALSAIVAQRCPRCREGRVFARRLTMNRECPSCGADFEREQGYFLGAMYFAYAFGLVVVVVPVTWLIVIRANPVLVGSVAAALLVALAPAIFRYSRVAWLHFDHLFDPLPDRDGAPRSGG